MRKLNLAYVSLVTLVGCSQMLGLGDYDIDPALDGTGGSSIGAGGAGGTQGDAGSDSTPSSGAPPIPAGGDPNVPAGGQSGHGGESPGQGGEGGESPREVIPCDSAACCTSEGGTALGVELLSDGGFELGTEADGQSPWEEFSSEGFPIVTITDDPDILYSSKSGDYYAYLSGFQEEQSTIYSENVRIPQRAGWMTLSGYRLFEIDVQDEVNEDFALIALYDPDEEDPVELPFWWGRPSDHPDGWGPTPIWRKFETSWDAAPHQGTLRQLGLRGYSDLYPEQPEPVVEGVRYSSTFLFDDVSLKAFTCVR